MKRSNLIPSDLSTDHLRRLASIFDCGSAKYIFLPQGVAKLMRQTGEFPWLPKSPLRTDGDLSVLREQNGQTVYGFYHFSCHHKKQLIKLKKQIAQIGKIVKSFIDKQHHL